MLSSLSSSRNSVCESVGLSRVQHSLKSLIPNLSMRLKAKAFELELFDPLSGSGFLFKPKSSLCVFKKLFPLFQGKFLSWHTRGLLVCTLQSVCSVWSLWVFPEGCLNEHACS